VGNNGLTLITFIAVVVAWVFFRADSITSATVILKGMLGINGFIIPTRFHEILGTLAQFLEQAGITFGSLPVLSSSAVIWILISLIICWFLPNVQEYMFLYQPSLDSFPEENKKPRFAFLRWKPSPGNAVAIIIIAVVAILNINRVNSFIYSQF